MDVELNSRLVKVADEQHCPEHTPPFLIKLTLAVLEAIRAHVIEDYPYRPGDAVILSDAIGVVTDYR